MHRPSGNRSPWNDPPWNETPWLAGSREIPDPDITLFHVMSERRLEGVAAVKDLYAPYGGRPLYGSYQIENPKVQSGPDMAILSCQLVTHDSSLTRKWNVTEVYQKKESGWRVIHSHFSITAGAQQ